MFLFNLSSSVLVGCDCPRPKPPAAPRNALRGFCEDQPEAYETFKARSSLRLVRVACVSLLPNYMPSHQLTWHLKSVPLTGQFRSRTPVSGCMLVGFPFEFPFKPAPKVYPPKTQTTIYMYVWSIHRLTRLYKSCLCCCKESFYLLSVQSLNPGSRVRL